MAVTFAAACELFIRLPGVVEGTAYGTPAFRVRSKFLARLHEDGDSLVLKVGELEQGLFISLDPNVYTITDHYSGTAYVLIRLSRIDPLDLRLRIEEAWRKLASKRDLAAYPDSSDHS
jgi:hypothetical protein